MAKKAVQKPIKEKKTLGRPILFTPELGESICDLISQGNSLRVIAEKKSLPSMATIIAWVLRGENGDPLFTAFSAQYIRAREVQAEVFAEQMLEISDNNKIIKVGKHYIHPDVQRDKLRVDTRKYIAGVSRPKKYGTKVFSEVTGKDGAPLIEPMSATDIARRMAFIFAEAEKETKTKGKPNANNKQK